MVVPSVKGAGECAQDKPQQPDLTQVNHINREVERNHEPGENFESTTTSEEHNQVSSQIFESSIHRRDDVSVCSLFLSILRFRV